VFDRAILDTLPRADRRVEFIWESVAAIKAELQVQGHDLKVRHAVAAEAVPQLATELGAQAVFTNHDYEPAAIARDTVVAQTLAKQGVAFHTFKDQVIFEKDEVLTGAGKFFSVFTPYKNAWLKALTPFHIQAYPVAKYQAALAKLPPEPMPSLEALGFTRTNLAALGIRGGPAGADALFEDFTARIDRYKDARDFPAVKGVPT
jgi:deoxyribodipyrimidine photo-lyase